MRSTPSRSSQARREFFERRHRIGGLARAGGERLRRLERARLAERDDDERLALGRRVDRAGEARHLALMLGRAGVGMAVLDHIGKLRIAALMAEEAAPRGLGEFRRQRGRDERPAVDEIIGRIAEVERAFVLADDRLEPAEALIGRLGQHHLHHRHDLQQTLVIAPIADAQQLISTGSLGATKTVSSRSSPSRCAR